MKLNDALAMQTFVAIPTSVSVADFALFFAAAEHIVGEDGGVDGQKTFAPYNGYVNLVRWFSYMQETYASVCASLNIEKVEFPFDSIDIHAPTPKLPESKKAAIRSRSLLLRSLSPRRRWKRTRTASAS